MSLILVLFIMILVLIGVSSGVTVPPCRLANLDSYILNVKKYDLLKSKFPPDEMIRMHYTIDVSLWY